MISILFGLFEYTDCFFYQRVMLFGIIIVLLLFIIVELPIGIVLLSIIIVEPPSAIVLLSMPVIFCCANAGAANPAIKVTAATTLTIAIKFNLYMQIKLYFTGI